MRNSEHWHWHRDESDVLSSAKCTWLASASEKARESTANGSRKKVDFRIETTLAILNSESRDGPLPASNRRNSSYHVSSTVWNSIINSVGM